MGNLGVSEIILILIIALIVFGPQKLPELGRTLGKALAEFRKHSADLRTAFEGEMRELERHAQEVDSKAQEALVGPVTEALAPPEWTVGSGSIDPRPEQVPPSQPETILLATEQQPQEKPADGDSKPAAN